MYRPRKLRAFTLIEVIISVSVMMLMMAVIFSEYPTSVMRAKLNNVGYNVSLLVRESQLRGSSISSGNNTLTDSSPYGGSGTYYSLNSSSTVTLFNDLIDIGMPQPYGIPVGNGIYENNGSVNETSTTLSFTNGFSVTRLCVGTGFPFSCNSDLGITSLTISFTRPKPEANIYVNNLSNINYSAACIEISSPINQKKSIQVYNSGMVRTLNTACK